MIELECELIFLQRYNLNQHKSTINHILTKKRALKTNAHPTKFFTRIKQTTYKSNKYLTSSFFSPLRYRELFPD